MLLVDEWNMNIEHTYNTNDRGKPNYLDKILSQHQFVHHLLCMVYMKDVQWRFTGLQISNENSLKHHM